MTIPGGTSPWDDADGARARVREQIAQAQETAARAQRMQAEITALRATARSRGGDITATSDASGALTALTLTDDAMERHPADLARAILETAAAARESAGRKAVELAEEALGPDSSGVAMLRAEVASRAAAQDGAGPHGPGLSR